MLNSFFSAYDRKSKQTEELHEWLSEQEIDKPIVLVTHQVNITALTSVYPSSGELVFIRLLVDGSVFVAGTIDSI